MSAEPALRIDLLLCRLRLAKTRGVAQRMVEQGHMRCNGAHVARPSHCVRAGDVLTFARGGTVEIVEILALPQRRGPAPEAQAHYRMLDRNGQSAIAAPVNSICLGDNGT